MAPAGVEGHEELLPRPRSAAVLAWRLDARFRGGLRRHCRIREDRDNGLTFIGQADERLAAPRSEAESPTPVVVLIVDDNPKKRIAMKSVLLPLGYQVVEADSPT